MSALYASFNPRSVSSSDREMLMRLTAGRPAVIWGPYQGEYQWSIYGATYAPDGISLTTVPYGGSEWPIVAVLWHDQSWYPSASQGAIERFRVSDYGVGYALGGVEAYDDIQSGAAAYSTGSRFASESERQTYMQDAQRTFRVEKAAAEEQAAADEEAAKEAEASSLLVKNIAGAVVGILLGWRPWQR